MFKFFTSASVFPVGSPVTGAAASTAPRSDARVAASICAENVIAEGVTVILDMVLLARIYSYALLLFVPLRVIRVMSCIIGSKFVYRSPAPRMSEGGDGGVNQAWIGVPYPEIVGNAPLIYPI